MAKLDNVLPDEQRSEIAWARRSLVATGMHRADPTTLAPLLEALRRGAHQQQQIQMTYQSSASPAATERRVDPYALVHRSGWWYMLGYCHLRRALRTFRVDRIQHIEVLNQPFQAPEDFDVWRYLDTEFKDQPVVRACLRFVPEAAHIVKTSLPVWESVQEHPDGSLNVTLTAPDLYWLASMVLSFGAWVMVLDPPELRTLVREWALGTAALYQD